MVGGVNSGPGGDAPRTARPMAPAPSRPSRTYEPMRSGSSWRNGSKSVRCDPIQPLPTSGSHHYHADSCTHMIASGAVMSGDALIVALWLHISGQKRVYGHPVRWLLPRAVRVGQVARRTRSSTGGASVRPRLLRPPAIRTPPP